jgi:DNA-binding NtrC family response regulator
MTQLCATEWRGNGRELENAIERALALTDALELGPADLPSSGSAEAPPPPVDRAVLRDVLERGLTLEQLQDLYTEHVLDACEGNKVRAAAVLGIDRKTLYRRAERKARQVL